VAGGNRPSGQSFAFVGAAELYDPATDTWTSAGTLAPAPAYHAATLLPSGKVFIIGSCEPTEAAPPQVYDPDLKVYIDSIKNMEEVFRWAGWTAYAAEIPQDKMADASFAENAVKVLGPFKP